MVLETLIPAAIGTVFSIGQGMQADRNANAAVQAQYEYDREMYEYNLEERDRLYDYAMTQTEIARNNTLNNINYQEQTAIQDWKFEESMSIRNYNSQVAAFNKSERVFEGQMQYNRAAADIAYQENNNLYYDRQVEAQFNLEKIAEKLGRQLADSAYNKASIKNQIAGQRQQTRISTSLKGVKYRSQEAQTAAKIQDLRMDGAAKEGRLMARGQQGNSIRKAQSSIANQVGMNQARLLDGLTRLESEYKLGVMGDTQKLANAEVEAKIQTNKLNTQDEYNKYAADRGRREVDESLKSAQRAYNTQNMQIANDLFGANLRADANRRVAPGARVSIPKPLALPRPDIQDPYRPNDPPEPVRGAGAGGVNTIGALAGAANNLAGLNWGAILNKP